MRVLVEKFTNIIVLVIETSISVFAEVTRPTAKIQEVKVSPEVGSSSSRN